MGIIVIKISLVQSKASGHPGINFQHNVQVIAPGLQARCWHSATAFSYPGVTKVIIFGGCPEMPSDGKSEYPQISNTTMLQFGMSH